MERRRAAAAQLVPHKGPAVKGNTVHIDYEGFIDGKAFAGGTAKDQALQLGSGRMIPGFEDGILGHKAGESLTSRSPSPPSTVSRTWPARTPYSTSPCTTSVYGSCPP